MGHEDGTLYIVSDFIQGLSLADWLSGQQLTTREAVELCVTIADALHYSHEAGVIHRDLKPANIMQDDEGQPHIMDFGLARREAGEITMTVQGKLLGTPAYMPPEQARGDGHNADRRSDLYSLGVILFELLTGELPFRGNVRMLVHQVLNEEPPSPRKLNQSVPRDLETITLKCLQKDPERRYQTTADLAVDLHHWLAGEPITSRPVSTLERGWRWCRRKPALAGMWSAAVLLLLTLGIGSSLFAVQQARNATEQTRLRGKADIERQTAENALSQQRQAEHERRITQANALRQATPQNAEFLLRELDVASPEIQDVFRTLLSDSNLSAQEVNRVRLGLLKVDDDQLTPIVAFLKSDAGQALTPQELRLVQTQLVPRKSDLQGQFEPLLSNPAQRLTAACLLAGFAADGDFWETQATGIAGDLVLVNPIYLDTYLKLLRPVATHLVPPLSKLFADPATGELPKTLATSLLAEYAADNDEVLTNLILAADPVSDRKLFPLLQKHRAAAVTQLETVLDRPLNSGSGREALVAKQAAAVTALLRLDATDKVWPVFAHRPDVGVRSHALHRLADYGVDADRLLPRLQSESDASRRAALIQGLGELARAKQLSAKQQTALFTDLSARYREDPHAGVHGAAEWSLRQCGQAEALVAMDLQLQGTDRTDKQWSINGQGQTMVLVDAGQFLMGSPATEEQRESNEAQHTCRITHGFAISTKEVTRAQWRVFSEGRSVYSADHEQMAAKMLTDDSPMAGITWYEAAWYCNWLSEQEEIPEDQWCYQPTESGAYAEGMGAKSDFQNLSGYRLPTEAEWEYACRGGTSTAYSFGESPALLGLNGWFRDSSEDHGWPVGSLRPNDLGLFDMHGNVYEWCGDWYGTSYADGDVADPTGPSQGSYRVRRGGSWFISSDYCRSANRRRYAPDYRYYGLGFRVLRSSIR